MAASRTVTPARTTSTWAGLASLVVLAACGGSPGTRPDDMSAARHHATAGAHEREASRHADTYDPAATTRIGVATRRPGVPEIAGGMSPTENYNPTAIHRLDAEEHRKIAALHRSAAEELERFEEGACAGMPPQARAACPLGGVDRVANIEGGVRLWSASGVPVEKLLAQIQCHLAFARTRAREGMDGCPLFVEGVRARLTADGAAVDVTAAGAKQCAELRRRFGGATAAAATCASAGGR